jgi:hexosaminidase
MVRKTLRILMLMVVVTPLQLFAQDVNLGIIPAPASIEIGEGQFEINAKTVLVANDSESLEQAAFFNAFLSEKYGFSLPVKKQSKSPSIIFENKAVDKANTEAYKLVISKTKVMVSGTAAGQFYAIQSLIQMLEQEQSNALLPVATINDYPRFAYRGMMLDVCRHYYSIEFIKSFIDHLAKYKINKFHWHLTEDQGWRLEIKKYPKLTQIGAYREATVIGNNTPFSDGQPYGGFYTQEQAKEIVKYAAQRHIEVIPEIELPGHALAALASYPELACNKGPFKVSERWGVFTDVYCAGKDGTFEFLQNVLDEVIQIFPSNYIHIGGDECPKDSWKKCELCQTRIKEEGLKDEYELQSYFIKRIEKYLNSKGRNIIGWSEILEGGLAQNATVMAWLGENGAIHAAELGNKAILTPTSHCYFDYRQSKSAQEPITIGGYVPLQKVYNYNPMPAKLTADQQKYIIGVQANIWTEYIKTEKKVEYMMFPRFFALSEIAWTQNNRKDFTNFSEQRLPLHLANFDKRGIHFSVPVPIGAKDTVVNTASYVVKLTPSVKGSKIYYSLDGYTPDATCLEYTQPITLKIESGQKLVFKAVTLTPSGRYSVAAQMLFINLPPKEPEAVNPTGNAMKYSLFNGNFISAQALNNASPVASGMTPNFEMKSFKDRFDTFGVVFEGYVKVDVEGVYTFTTTSDDGSILYVGNQIVVNNDGPHGPETVSGQIPLKKGWHKVKIAYFDGGGGYMLKATIAHENGNAEPIAQRLFF